MIAFKYKVIILMIQMYLEILNTLQSELQSRPKVLSSEQKWQLLITQLLIGY